MNCEGYQLDLEELLYGELDARRAAELRAHLKFCAACRESESRLARELELFSRYQAESEIEPSPAMWNAVSARIAAEGGWKQREAESEKGRNQSTGLWAWLLRPAVIGQFAGALALVVVTVGVTVYFLGRRDDGRPVAVVTPSPTPTAGSTPSPAPGASPSAAITPAPAATPVPTPASTAAPAPLMAENKAARPKTARPAPVSDEELIRAQVARAEREYVGAIRLLDRAIARRKGQIDANVFAQYEASLALIDDSIEKSRRAMREQPGDAAAGQFLLAAYARKVELMQEIALQ